MYLPSKEFVRLCPVDMRQSQSEIASASPAAPLYEGLGPLSNRRSYLFKSALDSSRCFVRYCPGGMPISFLKNFAMCSSCWKPVTLAI